MSSYKGKVIKAGNSYALRMPKDYVVAKDLRLGQEVPLPDRPTAQKGNIAGAMRNMQALVKKRGSMASIKDPVVWQRAMREEVSVWSEVIRDIGR